LIKSFLNGVFAFVDKKNEGKFFINLYFKATPTGLFHFFLALFLLYKGKI